MENPKDWYEEVCHQLDALKCESLKYKDEDEILPPNALFERVKDDLQNLRQLADFPALSCPDVWFGPDGEIGITWESDDRSLELLFFDTSLQARLTIDTSQQILDSKDISAELKNYSVEDTDS